MNKKPYPVERKTVVYTTKAKCRDCYRCVRACPVNAIKMEDGQAQVVSENCIACGTCITECPQHAKTYITDYGKVLQMLEAGHTLIATLAPSFAGYFNEWEQKRLPSALRAVGFHYVAETAVGAWYSAIQSIRHINEHHGQHHICSACPAVVNYITLYAPQYVSTLLPVASPMIAHAKMLKKKFPKAKVVFIGPCVAKKDEALQQKNAGIIDSVLTFDELGELLRVKNVSLNNCEESRFDQEVQGDARLFPLEGGMLRTANASTDVLDNHVIAISGFPEIKEILQSLKKNDEQKLIIEPLFCRYGCINGPAANKEVNLFTKRGQILNYAELNPGTQEPEDAACTALLEMEYTGKQVKQNSYTNEQIKEVLAGIGKHTLEDELNCTACGYNSCREKAVAVLDGLAEPDMCMPYMRRASEQKFDILISNDPNGIVILNDKLNIVHMNDAFKKMFSCSDSITGKNISYLIDPEPFEKLSAGDEGLVRKTIYYTPYNITAHVVIYSIPEQEQYVGVFTDMTDLKMSSDKLSDIKTETLNKAQELLDHQISMAQEIARFLGEHTAKEEVLLNRLMDIIKK